MRIATTAWALSALCTSAASALDAEGWKRQTIYEVITDRFARSPDAPLTSCNVTARDYCGGTWKGIESKLDYIQGMGFTAVWISPVVSNVKGPIGDDKIQEEPYHGYWPKDLYKLNDHFGTEQDLKDLSAAIHKRGMYLMVAVSPNQMGPQPHQALVYNKTTASTTWNTTRGWDGTTIKKNMTTTITSTPVTNVSIDYSVYRPFNDASYFHPFCAINYTDSTHDSIHTCWQGTSDDHGAAFALPDLRTEDKRVQAIFGAWIKQLVANYSIDGLRIDSAKHMDLPFLSSFQRASGVFNIGESLLGTDSISTYPDFLRKLDGAIINFPLYYPRVEAFKSPYTSTPSFAGLATTVNDLRAALPNRTSTMGSFVDFHDGKRFGGISGDIAHAKNSMAFAFLADGIPILYMGAEQRFSSGENQYMRAPLWNSPRKTRYATAPDAELYGWVSALNDVRSWLVQTEGSAWLDDQMRVVFNDTNTLAWKKGGVVGVLTNDGVASEVRNVTLPAPMNSTTTGLHNGTWTSPSQIWRNTTHRNIHPVFAPNMDYIDVLSCEAFRSSELGVLKFPLVRGMPRVFYRADALKNSGLCATIGIDIEVPGLLSVDVDVTLDLEDETAGTCVVTFAAEVETGLGEMVYLLGDQPQLGNGDMLQALVMDSLSYPNWTVSAELPFNQNVEYSLVKVNTFDGEIAEREGGNSTHKFKVDMEKCKKNGGRLSAVSSWESGAKNGTAAAGGLKARRLASRRSRSGASHRPWHSRWMGVSDRS